MYDWMLISVNFDVTKHLFVNYKVPIMLEYVTFEHFKSHTLLTHTQHGLENVKAKHLILLTLRVTSVQ